MEIQLLIFVLIVYPPNFLFKAYIHMQKVTLHGFPVYFLIWNCIVIEVLLALYLLHSSRMHEFLNHLIIFLMVCLVTLDGILWDNK